MIRRLLLALAALIVLLVAGIAAYVASRQNLKFDAPYPEIAASTDSAVIARGHYVVRNLANCAQCHGDTTKYAANIAGVDVPLTGGFTWNIPPGTYHARNITPDPETGIGRFADREVGRALRFGVGRDGRALLPFMEFQGLSDEDLVAVVSYLRTQQPVRNVVPPHRPNLLGAVVKATVLANPVGPKGTPLTESPRGATVENGRYLVESVALCWACHTQRSDATGELIGPRFGGATGFIEPNDPSRVWAPPNITSDPTGKTGKLTEDEFVARFRTGRVLPGSPMPWQGFSRLDESDIRAIYRYLRTVPRVHRESGPAVVDAKRK